MRLRNCDYSQAGAYFVTICTHNRACTLGEIQDTSMIMSEAERSVNSIWQEIPGHYTQVAIDAFVVMPNHVHGILFTNQPISNATGGALVRAFKARCTHAINKIHGAKSAPVWQRNYYEHVIRDEDDLMCIREYIANNPAQWALDEESPEFGGVHQGAMNHAPTVISLD